MIASWVERLRQRLTLAPDDLLRQPAYRRLFLSILTSSFGGQITMLALPLTAAVLLQATPTQMGMLTAMEIVPFLLLSLPGGVWLDRVRKLPVYIVGEALLALAVASVPLAWWAGWLTMGWLYAVGLVLGTVFTIAGSAAQVVLTQVVPRERLVEAHAKNALATSGAEVAGPGAAGALIKLVGAPFALLLDAALLLVSAAILRSVKVDEGPRAAGERRFAQQLLEGLSFVRGTPLLVTLALVMGAWQMVHHCAFVVQILVATRELGMTEPQVGLSYVAMGIGTVIASMLGHRLSARVGPGPAMVGGFVVCGLAWLQIVLAPVGPLGVASFALMLMAYSAGAVLVFVNFLALRQAVTPAPLLGRMTSTMRWLTLIPAAPGALLGGWLGEHVSLRSALAVAGSGALLLALVAWRWSGIRGVKALPKPVEPSAEGLSGASPATGAALS